MQLMLVNAASIIAAKPVALGSVPHRIECCCTLKNRLLSQMMTLFAQLPCFIQRRFRASEYRCRCSSRVEQCGRVAVWVSSPLFSGLGAASTAAVWCISAGAPPRPVDSFPFLVLAFVFHAYPAFGLILAFPESSKLCSFFSLFVFPRLDGR